MMWDHVMIRILARIQADTMLLAIFGDHVRMAGTGDLLVPVLEYTLLADTENELWTPFEIQFDLWTKDGDSNRQAERRMRQLFHRDLPLELDGVTFWGKYDDGTMLATPDRSQHVGRALRFYFTPLREQYARPQ